MATEIKLGTIAGLRLSATPSAIIGSVLLWALLGVIGVGLLNASLVEALVGGLVAVMLHWVAAIAHQFGHAWAARRTGFPMTGIRFWGVLSTSLYPPAEPALPAAVHRQRALGGPIASLLVTLAAAALALALPPLGELPWWIGVFFVLDNLVTFTVGAILPLGFTDGSTLLRWRDNP